MIFKVALAQIPVEKSISANLKSVKNAIRFAAENQANILLTPEGSLSGYTHEFDRPELKDALAETEATARELKVGLALGTCADEAGQCYNMLRFYLPDGTYLGSHTKTLRCGSLDDPRIGEVNHFGVKPLVVFAYQDLTIGGLICNDLWANPTCTPMDDTFLAYKLKRLGAQIIFHAVNGGRDESDFSQQVVRTFHEMNVLMLSHGYQIPIATVDNAAPVTIEVSSIGGVVTGGTGWAMRLPVLGEQLGCYEWQIR